ncbi:succinylglutamate desuccinylase/aspartoacylase domain-containing protein [Robertkochia aurantiaca]|uniref:succinylglutamate desuccinylase/aspartoacylase domain-containing protein n=1 Tax=Robertkochia aurantiaca TaxID=2873700 RepID=UPI001CCE6F4B|nr:succinylglutamate desuccinylase/aspartoacylase family protein [Robertkochia sp. 3YJGBD-33]
MKPDRVLYRYDAAPELPAVVFFCGIHGNEPAGVRAFEQLLPFLEEKDLSGSLYVLSGNLAALKEGVRYMDVDLNRIWDDLHLKKIAEADKDFISEHLDMREILQMLHEIWGRIEGPLYFIDFHTTSSASIPFITIDDSMINRNFSEHFPVPKVLGIEEYLNGTLLSFINRVGYVSLGFEAGQHQSRSAVLHAEAFMCLTLEYAGLLPSGMRINKSYRRTLTEASKGKDSFYEITQRYGIDKDEDFRMIPGFESFQHISAGTELALSDGKLIKSEEKQVLFMPLYQKQGADGYFFIREIPRWALMLSRWFRRFRLDSLLVCLPGVSWATPDKQALLVKPAVANFMARSIWHLLGYRHTRKAKGVWVMYNRERGAKKDRYPQVA